MCQEAVPGLSGGGEAAGELSAANSSAEEKRAGAGVHGGNQFIAQSLTVHSRAGQSGLVHPAGGLCFRGSIRDVPLRRVKIRSGGNVLRCAAGRGIGCTGGRVGHGVAFACQRKGSSALVLGGKRRVDALAAQGFKTYHHSRVSTNDEGIALGQLIAAAARRKEG